MAYNANNPAQSNDGLDDVDNIRNNFNALRECEKGTAYPGSPTGGQFFLKTNEGTNGRLYIRNATNTTWMAATIVSGTKMAFFQSAAPLGWTQDTSHNDKMLRVVSGAGGGSGGSVSPISHTHTTPNHTLTVSEIPSHNHAIKIYNSDTLGDRAWRLGDSSQTSVQYNSENTGGGNSHNHGSTGSVSIKYINMIICTKA